MDLYDRVEFFKYYGTRLGDALYAFPYDLDQDGDVDAYDYYAWKRRYGSSL